MIPGLLQGKLLRPNYNILKEYKRLLRQYIITCLLRNIRVQPYLSSLVDSPVTFPYISVSCIIIGRHTISRAAATAQTQLVCSI